jgi:hypothetical protein
MRSSAWRDALYPPKRCREELVGSDPERIGGAHVHVDYAFVDFW